jgi:glutathione S-transferase
VGVADRIVTERVIVSANKPNAAVMALNPLNKIPTLVLDDGTVVYDSRVIAEYLDTLHDGPRLHPADPAARLKALRRQALADGMLEVGVLWLGERNRPKEAQGESYLSAYRLKIGMALDLLESEGLDPPTAMPDIGQIAVGCALGYLDFRYPDEAWRTGRPGIAAWYNAFAQRPSMRATEPVDVY